MLSGRHNIVSGSLRRRCAQNRGLNLQESHLYHLFTQKCDHPGTENDAVLHLLVAQIKVTVFQPHLLPGLLRGHDLKRKRLVNPAQHLHLMSLHFDRAGGDPRIVRLLVPVLDLPGNRNTHLSCKAV